jgi:hypothetical protein
MNFASVNVTCQQSLLIFHINLQFYYMFSVVKFQLLCDSTTSTCLCQLETSKLQLASTHWTAT